MCCNCKCNAAAHNNNAAISEARRVAEIKARADAAAWSGCHANYPEGWSQADHVAEIKAKADARAWSGVR